MQQRACMHACVDTSALCQGGEWEVGMRDGWGVGSGEEAGMRNNMIHAVGRLTSWCFRSAAVRMDGRVARGAWKARRRRCGREDDRHHPVGDAWGMFGLDGDAMNWPSSAGSAC